MTWSYDQGDRASAEAPELNMFHGYPAELIAEWCCVALSTAFIYKSGGSEIPGEQV